MEWRCKQEIEDALWSAARKQLRAQDLARKPLLQAIVERTLLYTTERERLAEVARSPMSGVDLAARALFFSVADAAKLSIPLSELRGRSLLPRGKKWRVLDLGAGAGAMGLGLLSFAADHVPGLEIEVDAVDLDSAALALYVGAIDALAQSDFPVGASSVRAIAKSANCFEPAPQHYDLVLVGSMLNELLAAERGEVARRCLRALAPGGSLIFVEPALRETSRGLHQIRDLLLGEGAFVFAPCTRDQAPCPALADSRDWCHEDRPVVLPSRARQIAQTTGLRDGGMKFSYLVLRNERDSLVVSDTEHTVLRVVSQPQRSKGQRECFVCGESGRHKLRLLKRNRSPANRLIERANRGDVLIARTRSLAVAPGGGIEVTKSTPVDLLRPAEQEA